MEWSIGTHKYTQRRCWKVIYESHVTLSTGEMELSSALSSPQMMSHLLLQHGDDLTDSSRHRPMALAMTYTCDCLSAIWSLIAFILFQFENCFNQQPQHLQRAGWGYLRVFVCVDVVVVISCEPSGSKTYRRLSRESDTVKQEGKKQKGKFWPCNHHGCRDQLSHQCVFWHEHTCWQQANCQGCSLSKYEYNGKQICTARTILCQST